MRKIIASALLISALPTLAFAIDIKVTNNTDSYGTAYFNVFLKICSSSLGDGGILKPQEKNFTVPGSAVKSVCGNKNCEAFVFDTKNCSGNKIATVILNANSGVIDINNHASDRYSVTYNASSITINPPHKGFKSWFKSLF
jgi:hypothetical protein